MTGGSPYIHSRAIRCQLPLARSCDSTASVSISIRRPKRCSGRISWWRISRKWEERMSEDSITTRVAISGVSCTSSSSVYHQIESRT